jgi:hypothetical protein
MQGDMLAFDLGRAFDCVFIAANSQLFLDGGIDSARLPTAFDPILMDVYGSSRQLSPNSCQR